MVLTTKSKPNAFSFTSKYKTLNASWFKVLSLRGDILSIFGEVLVVPLLFSCA